MASRLIVLIVAFAACEALPVWFADNGFPPGTVFIREGRALDFEPPSIAYGFGSGFSSNIGGIKYSNGIGASFQTGDAQAYGSGIGSSDGNTFASGVGYANTNPSPQQVYRTNYPYGYSPYNGLRHDYGNNYGSAVSSAQNIGNYGTAVAQTHNSPYGSVAAAQNSGRYQTAISSAQNLRGHGYGSTLSSAASNGFGTAASSSSDGFGSAISSVQSGDQLGFNAAVSASQIVGGTRTSTAQTVQQRGGALQHSGATSIDQGSNGIQSAQSHAINTGYY